MSTPTIPTPQAQGRTGRRVVREPLRFELLDETIPPDCRPIRVRGLLRWTSADPYTVAVVFRPGSRAEVTWLVDRDLLVDGVAGPAGLGDLAVLPDLYSGAHRELVLSNQHARRGFRFPVAPLVAFLARTNQAGGA